MKWKLVVPLGVVFWLLVFTEVYILMSWEPVIFIVIHFIAMAFFTFIISYSYFRRDKGTMKKGFYLGVGLVLIALLLDALITVPFFVKSYDFYLRPALWAGISIVIILSSFMGRYMGKRPDRKIPVYSLE